MSFLKQKHWWGFLNLASGLIVFISQLQYTTSFAGFGHASKKLNNSCIEESCLPNTWKTEKRSKYTKLNKELFVEKEYRRNLKQAKRQLNFEAYKWALVLSSCQWLMNVNYFCTLFPLPSPKIITTWKTGWHVTNDYDVNFLIIQLTQSKYSHWSTWWML